jgi:predicted small metal-binding protein
MPSFKCKDAGMACPFEASAPTEAQLMEKIAKHAKEAHGMKTIPSDMMEKVKKAIKK